MRQLPSLCLLFDLGGSPKLTLKLQQWVHDWKTKKEFFARPEEDKEDEIRKSGTWNYSAVCALWLSSFYTWPGFVLCPQPQAPTLSRVISVDLEPRTRPHYYYLLPLMRRPGVVTTTICHKSGTDVLFPKKDPISGNIKHTSLFCNRAYSVPVESVGYSTRLPIGAKGNTWPVSLPFNETWSSTMFYSFYFHQFLS